MAVISSLNNTSSPYYGQLVGSFITTGAPFVYKDSNGREPEGGFTGSKINSMTPSSVGIVSIFKIADAESAKLISGGSESSIAPQKIKVATSAPISDVPEAMELGKGVIGLRITREHGKGFELTTTRENGACIYKAIQLKDENFRDIPLLKEFSVKWNCPVSNTGDVLITVNVRRKDNMTWTKLTYSLRESATRYVQDCACTSISSIFFCR